MIILVILFILLTRIKFLKHYNLKTLLLEVLHDYIQKMKQKNTQACTRAQVSKYAIVLNAHLFQVLDQVVYVIDMNFFF